MKSITNVFEVASIIFIGINIIVVIIGLSKYNNEFTLFLLTAYFIRIIEMFWDVYASHVFVFPGSGLDFNGFHESAVLISNDITLITENIYGGLYSKIFGLFYYLTKPERLIGQYINVLLGMNIIIIIYKILNLLELDHKVTKLYALFFGSIINVGVHFLCTPTFLIDP